MPSRDEPHIAQLHVYPVKSCAGIALDEAILEPSGIRYDRDWMVVDEAGVFVAQRAGSRHRGIGIPELCLVTPRIRSGNLELRAPDMETLRVPLTGGVEPTRVRVWSRHLDATDEGRAAADWFTAFLSPHRPGTYRLVRIRRVDPARLGFVDDGALLVQSAASLDDLNARLSTPVPQDRFRPSIVLDGLPPYAEDDVDLWAAGDVRFQGDAPCVRCPITMRDQKTATLGREPLRTLATYRRSAKGVVFGRYFQHDRPGRLSVGDAVRVLKTRRAPVSA